MQKSRYFSQSEKEFPKSDNVFKYIKNKNAVKASLTQFINIDILANEPYLIGYKLRVFTPPSPRPK